MQIASCSKLSEEQDSLKNRNCPRADEKNKKIIIVTKYFFLVLATGRVMIERLFNSHENFASYEYFLLMYTFYCHFDRT